MTKSYKMTKLSSIALLLIGAFVLRLLLASFGTLELDQNTFIAWGRRTHELGFFGFYNSWSDYLPGYIYVLSLLARIEPVVGLSSEILYKLPAIIADISTGYLIYLILKEKKKVALVASAAFLFNPAVLSNSTLWGQVDIFTSLTSLVAIAFIDVWPVSMFALALGIAIKPQALMAAPIVFVLALQKKWSINKFFNYGIFALVIITLLFMPFSTNSNLPSFIIERFNSTVDQYPYTSINAFNFWALWGFWKEEAGHLLGQKNIGILLLALAGAFTLLRQKLVSKRPYHMLAILFLTNFLFFTRMHERHLLPALAPLAIAAAGNPVLWGVYIGFSVTYVANMHYSYQWIAHDFLEVFPGPLIKILIITNLVLFVALVRQTVRPSVNLKLKRAVQSIKSFRVKKFLVKDRLSKKRERYLIIAIIFFSILIRLFRLSVPETDYFDEIYHAFTARQMLIGDSRPWHWSSPHPEGFAYEWTHPPLAKEIMAGSMGIFGVNSFAWRLPGALLGVVIVFMTYLIAKELFNSRDIAILSALLVSLDGLILTMSRIGTADVYFLSFALVSYYFFLKNRDFASSVFLGFAVASKWSTIWFLPVFGLSFLILRKKITKGLVWFFVIPPLVYLLSYLPMFSFGHDLGTFWEMQQQMWWYHSGLTATHPYTSPWWSWPILGRPVYLYQNYQNGMVENIYALGNPFFFWFGAVSILLSIYLLFKNKIKSLAVLVPGYFILFAPWAASPRIMFLYHYLPALPIIAMTLAFCLKKYRWALLPVILVIAAAFVYFYPHWTAIPVSEELDKTYYWFSSWR